MINRILRYFHSPRSITIIDRTICSRVDRHLRVSCAFAGVHARNTQERNEIRNELAHAAKGKERERERNRKGVVHRIRYIVYFFRAVVMCVLCLRNCLKVLRIITFFVACAIVISLIEESNDLLR